MWAGLAAAARLRLCVDVVVCVLACLFTVEQKQLPCLAVMLLLCEFNFCDARSAITIARFVLSCIVQWFVSHESLLV